MLYTDNSNKLVSIIHRIFLQLVNKLIWLNSFIIEADGYKTKKMSQITV